MESLVTVGAAAAAAATEAELDTTIPVAALPATAQLAAPVPTAAPSSVPAEAEPPPGDTEACWLQEGAKPKEHRSAALTCFTPNPNFRSSTPRHTPWITVTNKNREKRSSPRSPAPQDIPLTNRYSSLEEQADYPSSPPALMQQQVSPLPLLKLQRHPKPQRPPRQSQNPPVTAGAVHRRPERAVTVRRKSRRPSYRAATRGGPEPSSEGDSDEEVAKSLPVLLVGSSMVREVHISRCNITCLPGASTNYIDDVIPALLRKRSHVRTVVAHLGGINDLKLQQSSKLREDSRRLIDNILHSNKQCVISGPLPPPSFGDMKFSRLMQFHVWLKGHCSSAGIPYTDNFTTFLHRPDLFKPDGLHLNYAGSRLLALNINLALQSCKTFSI